MLASVLFASRQQYHNWSVLCGWLGQLKTAHRTMQAAQWRESADVVRRSSVSCLTTRRHDLAHSRHETTSRSSSAGVARRWQCPTRCCLKQRISCRVETSATYCSVCSRYTSQYHFPVRLLWSRQYSYVNANVMKRKVIPGPRQGP